MLNDNFDLETFAFEEINFSGRSFQVSGQSFSLSIPYSYTFQMGDQTFNLSTTVTIEGSLDKATKTIRVRFQGSDPDIGLGFLPPNKTRPEGEGFFRFSIKPRADAPSGAQITNKATIVFDLEDPMDTNEHVLTLDKEPPNVRTAALPSEQPSPLFPIRWEGSDDASGVREIRIWVSDDGSPFQLLDILGLGERAIPTEISFKGKFGHEYRFYAIAVDKVGNQQSHPAQPQAITRAGVPPRIAAGLKIVTLPIISEITDPKQVFNFDGDRWAWYDPTTNQYVRYPFAPASTLQVGKGFWARFVEYVTPNAKGELPDDAKPFTIQLKRGWNLIGNPWFVDLIWDLGEIKVQAGSETKTLKNAEGIVEPYAWRWDGSKYHLVFDSSLLTNVADKILAWEGAWIFAWQNCNLILPAPEGNRSRRTKTARKKPEGWFAKFVAQVEGQEGQGFFGVSHNTRLQIAQPPSPPETQSDQSVQVLFLDKNGKATVADFRTGLGQRQERDVVVK
ncbi:MAG: hypothetical protein RMK18_04520 [Armatimonadota bacterium]|nr:hypothetical protein [Armatimonadota bacterium]MCX7777445.1 hypothetical protein [Armatimonadota bacterium]MDW8025114.1 hypothetical protein [Armatimonadota bacterium]